MKHFNVVISVFIFFLLISCNSNNEFENTEKPVKLIAEKKFRAVFEDMILLESTVVLHSSNNIHTHKVMNVSSMKILKKHHVSKEEYIQSFEYYAQDKDKMMEIYAKILEDYNIQLSKLN